MKVTTYNLIGTICVLVAIAGAFIADKGYFAGLVIAAIASIIAVWATFKYQWNKHD